jgi:hypothetical protein
VGFWKRNFGNLLDERYAGIYENDPFGLTTNYLAMKVKELRP